MPSNRLTRVARRFRRGGAEHVLETYRDLHAHKTIGAHWMWVAIERVVAGEPEDEVLADYGYVRG